MEYDAQRAKNSLTTSDFVDLSLISDMFGDLVGRRVRDGLTGIMAELFARFEPMVEESDFQVFTGYTDRRAAAKADRHVDQQLEDYKKHEIALDQE